MMPENGSVADFKHVMFEEIIRVNCVGCGCVIVADERMFQNHLHEFYCWCDTCTSGPPSKWTQRILDHYIRRMKIANATPAP
jgi:hypothetical protein